MRVACLSLVLFAGVGVAATPAHPLPSWVPAQGMFRLPSEYTFNSYGEGSFKRGPSNANATELTERGHYWRAWIEPSAPKPWKKGCWDGAKVARAITDGLKRQGFVADYEAADGLHGSFHKGEGVGARYLSFSFHQDTWDSNLLNVVEVAPLGISLELPPPAPTPEKVADDEDYPFLARLPGWTLRGTDHTPGGMNVTLANGQYLWVDGGYVNKNYRAPDDLSPIALEDVYEAALTKAGWTITSKSEAHGALYAHWNKNGRDLWAYVRIGGPTITVIEVPKVPAITLKLPAATPERIGEKQDLPYLTPLPGWKLVDAQHASIPLAVVKSEKAKSELVGSGYLIRGYETGHISNYEISEGYARALAKAGWTITAKNTVQGFLYAHYDKSGRDLWLYLHRGQFEVSDLGNELQRALAKQCKVAIYGVNFDFDKATLRPDAQGTLEQVRALFAAEPKLAVEIGGHTDDVGNPRYNLKLSGQRADSVKAWLVKHSIAASRLTTHGYGDTVPIAPNDSDENRAKNRRVEMKKRDCR